MIDREALARVLASVTYLGGAPALWEDLTDATREWYMRQADAVIAYIAALRPDDAAQGTSNGTGATGGA